MEHERAISKQTGAAAIGAILAVIGTILGVAGYPVATVAAGAGEGIAAIVGSVRSRRERRKSERLHRLVQSIEERVRNLEAAMPVTEVDRTVDLFLEVVENALEDDEEGKTEFYAAVLEWICRKRPTAAQVRVLSDAVRHLSVIELVFFIREVNGVHDRSLVDRELGDTLVWSRLSRFGLSGEGARHNGSPTILGLALARFVTRPVAEEALAIASAKPVSAS